MTAERPALPPLLASVGLDELDCSDEIEQTGFWGRYKAAFGARPFAFRVGEQGRMLVLVRRIAPGLSLGYVPYGPDVPDPGPGGREELLLAVGTGARSLLPRDVVFLRFDLAWEAGAGPLRVSARLRRPAVEIQPAHTVLLDLRRTDAELLGAMHHKTRYNIGLSARRGVEVAEGGPDDLDAWYEIKLATDRRDGIVTHSRAYFDALLRTARAGARPAVRLLLARVGGRTVGGVIVSVAGRAARYLHGASADEARSTMFSYALQWEAVRLARAAGCTSYDLYGIPPDDDPAHPMHGLYRFKTGFGGTVVHRLGCHDVVLRPAAYAALRVPELARYAYYKRLRRLVGRLTRRRAPARSP